MQDVGGQDPGRRGHDQVAGDGAGRGQAGQGGGERLAGDEQHVVAEQETASQARAQGQQPEAETDGGAGDSGPGAGEGGAQVAQPSSRGRSLAGVAG